MTDEKWKMENGRGLSGMQFRAGSGIFLLAGGRETGLYISRAFEQAAL
jgi:hypothetical protein